MNTALIVSRLAPALVLGFAGSLHCFGMCGPLLLLAPERPRLTELGYHGGRLLSYGCVGLILGWSGAALDGWIGTATAQVVGGTVMIVLGLATLGLLSRLGLSAAKLGKLSGVLSRPLAYLTRSGGWESRIALGLATGFFPCGLLWAAYGQATAAANPILGALVMVAFGVASAPSLWLLPTLMRRLPLERPTLQHLAGATVLVLGTLFVIAPMRRDAESKPSAPCPMCVSETSGEVPTPTPGR